MLNVARSTPLLEDIYRPCIVFLSAIWYIRIRFAVILIVEGRVVVESDPLAGLYIGSV